MLSEYLTSSRVARRLDVTQTRVHQLSNEGKLPVAAHAGRMRLFDPVVVEGFAAERERRNGKR